MSEDHPQPLHLSAIFEKDFIHADVLPPHTPPPAAILPHLSLLASSEKPPLFQEPRPGFPAPHAPGDTILHSGFVCTAPTYQPIADDIAEQVPVIKLIGGGEFNGPVAEGWINDTVKV